MRLGIFGGTFDPVHYGHLLLAESCREALELDLVWFLPAAVSPLKTGAPPATAQARLEMLQLAIAGHDRFTINRRELDRGGISYTADTLAEIRAEDPTRQLFFLLGSDTLASFPAWREPERVCDLATLVCVDRPNRAAFDIRHISGVLRSDQVERIQSARVLMPGVDISSSDIRHRIAEGKSIRYLVPRSVEIYIAEHRLYRQ